MQQSTSVKVFKFGGASVKDAEGIRNVAAILQLFPQNSLVCVVSAMGKSTNALEQMAQLAWQHQDYQSYLDSFQRAHVQTAEQLAMSADTFSALEAFFAALQASLVSRAQKVDFLAFQDEVVAYGELLSTLLVADYLKHQGLQAQWADARQLIRASEPFGEAQVDWMRSSALVKKWKSDLGPAIGVIQGFIAADVQGRTMTLGREGSDYTAAIIAHILEAEEVSIWKDVPGVLTADPRIRPDVLKFDQISYQDAAEMTYYGAVVIHPKTIHPLAAKRIPLYVRPFASPTEPGTRISAEQGKPLPTYIYKFGQVLLSLATKDSSFIHEAHLGEILKATAMANIHVNMLQISATTLSLIFDADERKLEQLRSTLSDEYSWKYNTAVHLLTIKHYPPHSEQSFVPGAEILISQRTRATLQLLYRSQP